MTSGKILKETVFIGELSLNGNIEKAKGILPIIMEAKRLGIKRIILPRQNVKEVNIIEGIEILPVNNLKEVITYLKDGKQAERRKNRKIKLEKKVKYEIDFSEVKGQENAKRALEVAASGGHNCLLIRPTWFRKNHVSEKITKYFTRHEIRRNIRSYKNL